jgi:hypothetical protein
MLEVFTRSKEVALEMKQSILNRGVVLIKTERNLVTGVEREFYVYANPSTAEKHERSMIMQGFTLAEGQLFTFIYQSYAEQDFSRSMLVPVRCFSKEINTFMCSVENK